MSAEADERRWRLSLGAFGWQLNQVGGDRGVVKPLPDDSDNERIDAQLLRGHQTAAWAHPCFEGMQRRPRNVPDGELYLRYTSPLGPCSAAGEDPKTHVHGRRSS